MSDGHGQGERRDVEGRGEPDECDGCECDELCSRVHAAVEEGVGNFLRWNEKNIADSTKEQIASASYGGGMMDMVLVVRRALGRCAVEQLLAELDRMNKHGLSEDGRSESFDDDGPEECDDLRPEDFEELEESVARWVEDKKGGDRQRSRDPMFG